MNHWGEKESSRGEMNGYDTLFQEGSFEGMELEECEESTFHGRKNDGKGDIYISTG